MYLISISLDNFRSYKKKKFHFSPNLSIIIGPNASGKTNLLEAIFLLAIGKSFRTDETHDMISEAQEVGRVKGEVKTKDKDVTLEVMLTRGQVGSIPTPYKKYMENGISKRLVDFAGILRATLFWPEDLELIIGSPVRRRRYMDFVLMQIDREYRRSLLSYEKGLRQRNKLLELIREGKAGRGQLIFWNQLLIKNGDYIAGKREELLEFMNRESAKDFDIGRFQLTYDRSVISTLRLEQYAQEEIVSGSTLVGPHRDDFFFEILEGEKPRNLHHFGSRGEQRLGILWMKLAELHFIKANTLESPLLILDDIFSELDHKHREIIFDIIGNQQTIITTTDEHFIGKKHTKDGTIITL